jgi:DNA polymerase-3 subunit alpha
MGLKRLQVVSFAELLQQRGVSRAKLAGIVVGRQERTSQKGNRYAFVQLTDASGLYEATVFSERLVEYRELLEPGRAILLTVDVRTEEENLRLMVAEAAGLDQAVAATAAGLRIYLRDPAPVSGIKQILDRAGRGKGKVQISLDLADFGWETSLTIKGGFAISGAVRSAIKAVPGVMDIQDS